MQRDGDGVSNPPFYSRGRPYYLRIITAATGEEPVVFGPFVDYAAVQACVEATRRAHPAWTVTADLMYDPADIEHL